MQTQVILRENSDGWSLETLDEFHDVLAGPYTTEKEAIRSAKDLDLEIATTQVAVVSLLVRDRQPNDLFRIGGYWYRLKSQNNKTAQVDVVGENRSESIPADTEITEISVTSLK